jgi:hypothetical protein
MTAYVAHVLSARQAPDACTGTCWNFHPGFELELDPVLVLAGSAPAGPHAARHYSHAGFPEFAGHEHALVFEFATAEGALLSRTAFPVVLSSQGRWTWCADDSLLEQVRGRGRSVRFAAPTRYNEATREFAADALRYGTMPAGQRACRRGIYAEELVDIFAASVEPQGGLVIKFRNGPVR